MAPPRRVPLRVRQWLTEARALVFSGPAKDSGILFAASVVNAALGLLTTLVASRSLGPAGFGILGTFIAISTTLIGITNLGLDTAAIKLISSYRQTDARRAAVIMKVILRLEIASGLLIAVIGLAFSRQIAELLGGTNLTLAVRLAFVAAAFGSAAAFVVPFFTAYRQFGRSAIVSISGVVVRTVAVLALVAFVGLTVKNALWAHCLAPIVLLAVGFATVPRDYRVRASRDESRQAFSEVYHFSKWILLSYVATVITSRVDVYLLLRLKGEASVGYYSVALQLNMVFPMLVGALTTALLPRVTEYRTRAELSEYLRRVVTGGGMLIVALVPVVVLSGPLIDLLFGSRFENSVTPFQIMFAGYLISLVANPISLVLYAGNRPRLITISNYAQLVISTGLNIVLIPLLGLEGAALAFLGANVAGAGLSILFSVRHVRAHADV